MSGLYNMLMGHNPGFGLLCAIVGITQDTAPSPEGVHRLGQSQAQKGGIVTYEEAVQILRDINSSGMQHTFEFYSGYEHVDDEEFHKLRQKYLDAGKALKKHIDRYNVTEAP